VNDLLLAVERHAAEDKHRNLVVTRSPSHRAAIGCHGRHLTGNEVDPELGQPLTDTSAMRTPFGLEQMR
jgi:hypothetical protein